MRLGISWSISRPVGSSDNIFFCPKTATLDTMIHLAPTDYPRDFYYHRTSAEIYRPYIESCGNIDAFDIGNDPQYAWKK